MLKYGYENGIQGDTGFERVFQPNIRISFRKLHFQCKKTNNERKLRRSFGDVKVDINCNLSKILYNQLVFEVASHQYAKSVSRKINSEFICGSGH